MYRRNVVFLCSVNSPHTHLSYLFVLQTGTSEQRYVIYNNFKLTYNFWKKSTAIFRSINDRWNYFTINSNSKRIKKKKRNNYHRKINHMTMHVHSLKTILESDKKWWTKRKTSKQQTIASSLCFMCRCEMSSWCCMRHVLVYIYWHMQYCRLFDVIFGFNLLVYKFDQKLSSTPKEMNASSKAPKRSNTLDFECDTISTEQTRQQEYVLNVDATWKIVQAKCLCGFE